MVDSISRGRSTGVSPADSGASSSDKVASTRKGIFKAGILTKRQAAREDVAQTRQAGSKGIFGKGKGVGKATNAHKDKASGKPPSAPAARSPVDDSRQSRRARLQQSGTHLAQHKQEHARASEEHRQEVTQRIEQEQRARADSRLGKEKETGANLGKEVVEIKRATLDKFGMRDRLGALHEMADHMAAGRTVRMKEPPPLVQRKAALREGHQGFASRLGIKIKDMFLRIFRPRQWEARQVELSLARKDELRAVAVYSKKLLADMKRDVKAENARMARNEEREQESARNKETSAKEDVKEPSAARLQGVKRAYVVEYDSRIQQDPQYKAEKAILEKGVTGLRTEMEDDAKRRINEAIDRQQANKGDSKKTNVDNEPRQTSL